jgi:hypothetical protein
MRCEQPNMQRAVLQSVLHMHQQPRDLVFLKYCVRMPGIGGRADTYEIGVRVRATTHTDARPHGGSFKCPRVATFMLLRSLRDPWPNPDLWTRSAANPDYGHQIRGLGPAHRSAFSLLQINLGWDPPSHGHARLLAINPLRRGAMLLKAEQHKYFQITHVHWVMEGESRA